MWFRFLCWLKYSPEVFSPSYNRIEQLVRSSDYHLLTNGWQQIDRICSLSKQIHRRTFSHLRTTKIEISRSNIVWGNEIDVPCEDYWRSNVVLDAIWRTLVRKRVSPRKASWLVAVVPSLYVSCDNLSKRNEHFLWLDSKRERERRKERTREEETKWRR